MIGPNDILVLKKDFSFGKRSGNRSENQTIIPE
jgi:hypothetical protein